MAGRFHTPSETEIDEIRRRLPKVGMEYSGILSGPDVTPALVSPGMPRPKLNGVPIPATSLVRDGELSIIHSDDASWRKWLEERRCDLCVEPVMGEERAWFVAEQVELEGEERLIARGVMHRRCWLATSHWCPHLREGLLDGHLVAGSCRTEDLADPELTTLLRDDGPEPPTMAGVTAEYAIAAGAVRPEWPFRRASGA